MGDIKPKPAQYFINIMEKILEEKRKNQTNEKWFCNLPTEEKAKVISKLDCYHGNVYEIEQWLKDIHENEGK